MMATALAGRARRGPRRGLRSRRCCRTSCSTTWTGSSSGAVIGSCATPTTFASTSDSERAGQRVWRVSRTLVEQRLKLRVNREKVGGGPGACRGPCWGLASCTAAARVRIGDRPKARQAGQGPMRELTSRKWGIAMERRIQAINRFTVGWMGYFALADRRAPVPRPGRVAAPQAEADALEGMETRPDTGAGTCARSGSPAGTPVSGPTAARDTGGSPAPGPLHGPCPTPTGRATACRDSPNPTAVSETRANRRMRTRMSGGVGGAGRARPLPDSGDAQPLFD